MQSSSHVSERDLNVIGKRPRAGLGEAGEEIDV